MRTLQQLLIAVTMLLSAGSVFSDQKTESLFKKEIAKRYPGARIELDEVPVIKNSTAAQIKWASDDGKGVALFQSRTADGAGKLIRVPFSAFISAPIAVRRIRPMDRLSKDLFTIQEVDISKGIGREYRGLILSQDANLNELEARNTILEGGFPILTAVQKVPTLRRGDPVKVRLISGDLILNTTAMAQEPGYTGSLVRVLTTKTKKELAGQLQSDGTVEVTL